MIPHSFIQELLNRLDIVDVVERYLPLKKAGVNYKACCPFHNEKTPSFTVSSTKQFYHCFGCGAHGSAIGFVMAFHGIGFIDAVKELASSVGMTVPDEPRPRAETNEPTGPDLHEILSQAMRYYREQLKQSERAITYLKGRGLSGEIAARYGIGYAPGGWHNLETALAGHPAKALSDAGLLVTGEDGNRYDRFRDRIMFPIVNPRGLVIGFGGRVLDQGEPKYLNSPETPLFEKGRELYGLYQARKAIREAGLVIVVEGYMDVVALAQNGIEYAVATLGTACTAEHVHKLLRQSDRVVFCFDGDNAGRRAAWRALENSLGHLVDGKSIQFLFLPQGEDPDSYVRSRGKDAFEALLGQAVPLTSFLLKELVSRTDLETQEGRARLLQDAKPLITRITAPALGLILRKRLAETAGISQGELETLYQIKSLSRVQPSSRKPLARRAPSIVRSLIEMLLYRPEFARLADPEDIPNFREYDLGSIPREEMAALSELLEFLEQSPQLGSSVGIIEGFRGSPRETLLSQALSDALSWEEKPLEDKELAQHFTDSWSKLLDRVREARIDSLHKKLQQGGWTPEDKALYLALLQRNKKIAENEKSSFN